MISKLPITYPALPLGRSERGEFLPVASTTSRRGTAADRYRETVKATAAVLITAILTLGFVLSSQGIGLEHHSGVGPDQPPQPVLPAPAPAPSYGAPG